MRGSRHHMPMVYWWREFAARNHFYFSVAITVLLFYFSIILFVSRALLGDPDILWHIHTGQWILDHAQVPTVDLYSYTAVGTPWISTEWLAEIFFALCFKIGEWHGVVILSALACAAIIAIICFYLVRTLRFSVAIGWTALTAVAISPHFLARPHLFAYIVASIWVIKLLESYDSGGFRSSIPYFCVLMVLWANLHPSFTFGLALLGVVVGYSCCEKILRREYLRCKDELLTVIVVTISALLTPYGVFSALLTIHAMNMKYAFQHIGEWLSPNFQQNRIQLFLIVGFLMTMTGLGVRVRGPRLIMYGMTLILGLSYVRGLTMFYLLTPIIFAKPVADAIWFRATRHERAESAELSRPQGSRKTRNTIDPVLLYLQKRSIMIPTMFLAVAIAATAASWHLTGIGPPDSVAPKAALDFVTNAGITGNVFNSYNFGGYLIFKGIPTFVDGRQPPYTDDFLQEYDNAETLADIKHPFRLLDKYDVKWVLLLPSDPLVKALAASNLWNDVYSDKFAVVFVRSQ
jgi:hypothetical protein